MWCQEVMELKAGLLARHFRNSVSRGSDELPLAQTLGLLTFKIFYMQKNQHNTLQDWKKHLKE